MKVVYQTCCGIDVHKSFLVATIIKTTKGIQSSYQKKRFSTFNSDIRRFKHWLLENSCFDVCMEFTGKYWIPVFNLLKYEINVTIANPNLDKPEQMYQKFCHFAQNFVVKCLSGLRPLKATKMIPKIPNGLAISSVSVLSPVVLFPVRISYPSRIHPLPL